MKVVYIDLIDETTNLLGSICSTFLGPRSGIRSLEGDTYPLSAHKRPWAIDHSRRSSSQTFQPKTKKKLIGKTKRNWEFADESRLIKTLAVRSHLLTFLIALFDSPEKWN